MAGDDLARAVVTLCDAHYVPGLVRLHASISTSEPHPIICYDAGLSPQQRESLGLLPGMHVLDLPDDDLIPQIVEATRLDSPLAKVGKRSWPLWICPLLIAHAPARDVVWLDCDLVVLRELSALFSMLDDGPVFTAENLASDQTANADELYRLLPIERPFDRRMPMVNGGVSAWRKPRDHRAIDAYLHPVREGVRNEAVRSAIAWHDQGALIWAIQSLGLEDRVLADTTWNLSVAKSGLSEEQLAWDQELLPRLRRLLPGVRILHWNGRPAPWLEAGG